MDIAHLPTDLFLLVITHLAPQDLVRCRRVSRSWQASLAQADVSLECLKQHFPRCREVRLAAAADALRAVPASLDGLDNLEVLLVLEWERRRRAAAAGSPAHDWAAVFARVASRYHHLARAEPRTVEYLAQDSFCFRPVPPWNRFLRLNGRTAPFHHADPPWAYAADDGLLVYASPTAPRGRPYRLLDLETRQEWPVPFDVDDSIVRRLRLAAGVLIFEWADARPWVEPDDARDFKPVRRHRVTVLDVARRPFRSDDERELRCMWTVTPRCEWNTRCEVDDDRSLSTHNAVRYASYVWQHDLFVPGHADHVFETVFVWDISSPAAGRPTLVFVMHDNAFGFYGIRQGDTPALRSLALDGDTLYLTEEEHRWAAGPHASLDLPRVHSVCTTGIPIGPSPEAGSAGLRHHMIHGPRSVDACGADGDVHMSFCRRLHGPDGQASPAPPGAEVVAAGPAPVPQLDPDPSRVRTGPFSWDAPAAPQALASSRRHPHAWARPPGAAPCWRHEDFPYLTVAEAVDAAAGVRFAARRCFMMELLSVHVRPTLSVTAGRAASGGPAAEGKNTPGGRRKSIPDADGTKSAASSVSGSSQDAGTARVDEVPFPDDMWGDLMGAGFIAGDERWLIGQNEEGFITIVRF